jgi:hypothetical protein
VAQTLPYLSSNKNIGDLFKKIHAAQKPETFTQAYLRDMLGLKGSNDRPLIPFLRALGFLNGGGRPTPAYDLLKNQNEAKAAVAEGVRRAYDPLFRANESANALPPDQLKGLVSQVAGTDEDMTARIAATITDFVNYLRDKEHFFRSTTRTQFEGAEEDLLALYLHRGKQFPSGYDAILIGDNVWDEIQAKPEYKAKVAEDAASYFWDGLIETFCKGALSNDLEFGSDLTSAERAIRIVARENRFSRRVLAKSFEEFLDSSHEIRARMNQSPSGVTYVFLATPHGTPRNFRVAELSNRCFVARGLRKDTKTVVGIATEQYEKGKGFSLDLVHLHIPTWTAEAQARMEAMQKELGYFVAPRKTLTHEDEYPIQ